MFFETEMGRLISAPFGNLIFHQWFDVYISGPGGGQGLTQLGQPVGAFGGSGGQAGG